MKKLPVPLCRREVGGQTHVYTCMCSHLLVLCEERIVEEIGMEGDFYKPWNIVLT